MTMPSALAVAWGKHNSTPAPAVTGVADRAPRSRVLPLR